MIDAQASVLQDIEMGQASKRRKRMSARTRPSLMHKEHYIDATGHTVGMRSSRKTCIALWLVSS